jgi:uncharacterized membrane protein YuzA (DUF378 family)
MNKVEKKYWMIKLRMVMLALVFAGAINWACTAFGFNLVDIINNKFNQIIGMNLHLNQLLYIGIGVSAIFLASKQSTWLPFLGWTALPGSLIPLKENKGDITVSVNVKPNTRVAYWSAIEQKDTPVPNVLSAYKDFSNSGVVMSNKDGLAQLTLQKGTDYVVPSGKTIKRHVHYRTLDHEYGMVGHVKTAYY